MCGSPARPSALATRLLGWWTLPKTTLGEGQPRAVKPDETCRVRWMPRLGVPRFFRLMRMLAGSLGTDLTL